MEPSTPGIQQIIQTFPLRQPALSLCLDSLQLPTTTVWIAPELSWVLVDGISHVGWFVTPRKRAQLVLLSLGVSLECPQMYKQRHPEPAVPFSCSRKEVSLAAQLILETIEGALAIAAYFTFLSTVQMMYS